MATLLITAASIFAALILNYFFSKWEFEQDFKAKQERYQRYKKRK